MKPIVVKLVNHRALDSKGRRLGRVAKIQERDPDKMISFGGRPWAAWAQKTIDGVEQPYVDGFDSYDTESQARKHAEDLAGSGGR